MFPALNSRGQNAVQRAEMERVCYPVMNDIEPTPTSDIIMERRSLTQHLDIVRLGEKALSELVGRVGKVMF